MSNIAFGRILIPGLKLNSVLLIITASFGLVGFWNELDLFSLGLVTVVVVASAILTATTAAMMSAVYDYSSQFKLNIRKQIQNSGCEMQKQHIQEIRACQVIRCEVGNLYHMESKAKMTMVNTIVNGLVFLIVQRKSELR
jgi:hypothetical protein